MDNSFYVTTPIYYVNDVLILVMLTLLVLLMFWLAIIACGGIKSFSLPVPTNTDKR